MATAGRCFPLHYLDPQEQKALAPADFPAALASSFTAHPTVEVACDDGRTGSKSKDKAKAMLEALSLSVPLGPSPFHRLLLHALCQYWRLRSKSECLQREKRGK